MSSDASAKGSAGQRTERTTERAPERAPLVRRMLRAVLGVYMRLYHRLELHGAERLPSRGPAIVLVNHASLLDVPALMVLDPYPNTVFIAKADRTKNAAGEYSPDIAVGAAQYAGSIYDQGGYIYAAGMVIYFTPPAFVIAEHTKDLDRVSNVVRYEGEHLVLYFNDRQRYEATKDHSKGGSHPILQ